MSADSDGLSKGVGSAAGGSDGVEVDEVDDFDRAGFASTGLGGLGS